MKILRGILKREDPKEEEESRIIKLRRKK